MIIVGAAYLPIALSFTLCVALGRAIKSAKISFKAVRKAISIVSALSAYLVVGQIASDSAAYAQTAPTANQEVSAAFDDNIITGATNTRKPKRRLLKKRRVIQKKPQVKYDKWGFKIRGKRGAKGHKASTSPKAKPRVKQKQQIDQQKKATWFSNHESPVKKSSSGGKYRTMCVRLRDGYYWPISFKAKYSELKRDAERCANSCMDPVRLFYGVSPGKKIAFMRDLNGKTYKSLKNAFRYRKEYVKEAVCKPQPWTREAKNRHEYFASPSSFTSVVRYFGAPEFTGEKQLMATRINIRKLAAAEQTTWVNKLAPVNKVETLSRQKVVAKVEQPPEHALMYERQKFAVLEQQPGIKSKYQPGREVEAPIPPLPVAYLSPPLPEAKKLMADVKIKKAKPLHSEPEADDRRVRLASVDEPEVQKVWFEDMKFRSDGNVFARTQYHYMRRRKKIRVTSTRPWELQSAGRRVDS